MTHVSGRELAVITGASSGIGLELARHFATHGYDLIVAAENAAIFTAAQELERSGASVEAVQVDLTTPAGVDELYSRIESAGRPIAAAVLNAGIAVFGAFATGTRLETELEMIDLNVRSTVHLAKRVTADMVRCGEGKVLFTSSSSAAEPGPHQAVYAASKAFVQSFAFALREELQDTGVTVTTLMPGPTDTPLFERARTRSDHLRKDDPAAVARAGFEGLANGDKLVVTDSTPTTLRSRVGRLLPRSVKRARRRLSGDAIAAVP